MPSRAARGYSRRAVDQFLARCATSLGDRAAEVPGLPVPTHSDLPPLDAGDVHEARFPVVLGGYDMREVDALLARVARELPAASERPGWGGPVTQVECRPLRLRRSLQGYDAEQVLTFLTRCAHTLGPRVSEVPELASMLERPRTGTPVRARDVETVQFRLRLGGVSVEQVDGLLDRVADVLAR
ncbi:MAG: DivIVA domain-containing protein [Actinomycetes bacterium]